MMIRKYIIQDEQNAKNRFTKKKYKKKKKKGMCIYIYIYIYIYIHIYSNLIVKEINYKKYI